MIDLMESYDRLRLNNEDNDYQNQNYWKYMNQE